MTPVGGGWQRGTPPKCRDCNTTINLNPWPRGDGGYVWRCGSCQYLHENPSAARVKRGGRKVDAVQLSISTETPPESAA